MQNVPLYAIFPYGLTRDHHGARSTSIRAQADVLNFNIAVTTPFKGVLLYSSLYSSNNHLGRSAWEDAYAIGCGGDAVGVAGSEIDRDCWSALVKPVLFQ